MANDEDSAIEVRTCLNDLVRDPKEPTTRDVLRAMQCFMLFYVRHHQLSVSNNVAIEEILKKLTPLVEWASARRDIQRRIMIAVVTTSLVTLVAVAAAVFMVGFRLWIK